MLPSTSSKRVDDADSFNDLPVIHVFGQQCFASGGFSGADNQRISERKLMKYRNDCCNNFFFCRAVSAFSSNHSKMTSKEGKVVEVAGVEPATFCLIAMIRGNRCHYRCHWGPKKFHWILKKFLIFVTDIHEWKGWRAVPVHEIDFWCWVLWNRL